MRLNSNNGKPRCRPARQMYLTLQQQPGAGGAAMMWVTRKNATVDRIACPWLSRRFIDKDAEFLFVSTDEVSAVAQREGAIPYDVKGAELGHVDGRCSFESIMVKYQLTDPALQKLARIVYWGPVAAHIQLLTRAAGAEGSERVRG